MYWNMLWFSVVTCGLLLCASVPEVTSDGLEQLDLCMDRISIPARGTTLIECTNRSFWKRFTEIGNVTSVRIFGKIFEATHQVVPEAGINFSLPLQNCWHGWGNWILACLTRKNIGKRRSQKGTVTRNLWYFRSCSCGFKNTLSCEFNTISERNTDGCLDLTKRELYIASRIVQKDCYWIFLRLQTVCHDTTKTKNLVASVWSHSEKTNLQKPTMTRRCRLECIFNWWCPEKKSLQKAKFQRSFKSSSIHGRWIEALAESLTLTINVLFAT